MASESMSAADYIKHHLQSLTSYRHSTILSFSLPKEVYMTEAEPSALMFREQEAFTALDPASESR